MQANSGRVIGDRSIPQTSILIPKRWQLQKNFRLVQSIGHDQTKSVIEITGKVVDDLIGRNLNLDILPGGVYLSDSICV